MEERPRFLLSDSTSLPKRKRPIINGVNGEALVQLARERFHPDLREIEIEILLHSSRYEDPPDNPAGRPDRGWHGPEVRPDFLRWLIADATAAGLIEPRGIRVWGARVPGDLDLQGCRSRTGLEFRYCVFIGKISLMSAEFRELSFRDSTLLNSLEGTRLTLYGPLILQAILAEGKAEFEEATFGGDFSIEGASLSHSGVTLSLNKASIGNDLSLQDLSCAGSIIFDYARIGGAISIKRVSVTSKGGEVSLDWARVQGSVSFADNFHSSAQIRFTGAVIVGSLNFFDTTLSADETALTLEGAKIGGNVFLFRNFEASGRIFMLGVDIGGQLNCDGARLTTSNASLILNQAVIRGDIFLGEGFECFGAICALGLKTNGLLNLEGAKLRHKGRALWLETATIGGSVFMGRGFDSTGAVNMLGAKIEGQLHCDGATLREEGDSLTLDLAKIRDDVILSGNFESKGEVRMCGAQIGGEVTCDGALMSSFRGENAQVHGDIHWTHIQNADRTALYLQGAQIKGLVHDANSWPGSGKLFVNGLVVQGLHLQESRSLRADDGIRWLNLQNEKQRVEPQPWMQLAKLLEEKGHKRDAKRAIFELSRHQARAQWKEHWIRQRLAILFARLEEQPLRILVPILVCVAIGTSMFWPLQSHFAPTGEAAYRAADKTDPTLGAVPAYPRFQPVIYSLENVLPIVKLGQDDKWAPDSRIGSKGVYWSLMSMRWFLILSGWAQGIVLAAAVSARFRN